jgi:hypothetical protein
MIGRKSATRLTGLLYGLFFGSSFSAVALQIFPHSHPVLKCLIITVFAVSFYCVGVWVSTREELNKKFPTPSHELRRRRKDFYDWLDSQGRR